MPEDVAPTGNASGENLAKDVAPPWSPLVLGAASVVFTAGFSALWGGVMASLNRRRLGAPRIAWWPLVIGVLALGTSVASSIVSGAPLWMSPYSRIVWLVKLPLALRDFWIWWIGPAAEVAGCLIILLTSFLPQQRMFREKRKNGGPRSGIAIPVLTGFVLVIVSVTLDSLSQQRFFAEIAETVYHKGLEEVAMAETASRAGLKELADDRWEQALKEFDQAIQIATQIDSDHTGARIERARLRGKFGKDAQALEDYTHAVDARPDDLDLRLERAGLAVASGEDQLAIEDTDLILKEHPDDALARYTRAVAYEHQQKVSQALDDLNEAVKAAPKSALMYFERGRVRFRLTRIDEAIEDFTKAIELSPEDPVYRVNRGMAYLQNQELQKAIEDFTKAVEQRPQQPMYRYYRGTAYLQLQELRKAIEDFDKAIEQADRRVDFYWARDNTYLELGEPQNALADCNTVLKLIEKYGKSDPGAQLAESRTLSLRARSYVRLNELKKAQDDAGRSIKLDPKWADGWLARGLAEMAQHDAEAAEKDLTQAIELATAADRGIRARALYYRGQLRIDQGKTEQGRADQEEAQKIFPQVTRAPALPGEPAPGKE